MKNFSKLRIILSLALIFVLGAAAGASFSRGAVQRERAALPAKLSAVEDQWLTGKRDEYSATLGLSAEQLVPLQPTFDQTRRDLRTTRETAGREVRRIMGQHYRALERVLTPEQRVIFKQRVEEKMTGAQKAP